MGSPVFKTGWRVALRAAVGSTPMHSRLKFLPIPRGEMPPKAYYMTIPANETDRFTPIVARVLKIEELTWGDREQNFIVRYRGRLIKESVEAYDQLAESLRPLEITPLFREEEGRHAVILVPGVVNPSPSNPRMNLILFLLTLLSMFIAGTIYAYDGPIPTDTIELIRTLVSNLDIGVSFGLSLLAILLAHEFGHYLACRYHKTAVTLPYFIPFPLSPFGTLGAFIRLKEPPKNKRILLDIGIAGPLAGLAVTIPVLLWGLHLSPIQEIPLFIPEDVGLSLEGNSILYLLAKFVVKGEWLPMPRTYGGVAPALYWLRYVFTGLPTPLGGSDVFLHPVAWAGWAGLLVTALNLIPAGQLDGGHVLYVLLGKRTRDLLPVIVVVLGLLGLAWMGWWLWVVLIYVFGRVHAEPLDQITPLDNRRIALALLGLVVFILVFIPVPLRAVFGPYVGP